jgi:hypothetical protein
LSLFQLLQFLLDSGHFSFRRRQSFLVFVRHNLHYTRTKHGSQQYCCI